VSIDEPQRSEASESERYVTIRAGGPFDGAVTVAATAGARGRSVVIVSWVRHGHARWDTIEVPSFEQGLAVARSIADQLAAGGSPDLVGDEARGHPGQRTQSRRRVNVSVRRPVAMSRLPVRPLSQQRRVCPAEHRKNLTGR
jgi:hypothetical protein